MIGWQGLGFQEPKKVAFLHNPLLFVPVPEPEIVFPFPILVRFLSHPD